MRKSLSSKNVGFTLWNFLPECTACLSGRGRWCSWCCYNRKSSSVVSLRRLNKICKKLKKSSSKMKYVGF